MTYIDGFVLAVPAANKDAYITMASDGSPLFHEFGCTRHVEAWGDDVPHGKLTDFYRAVKATEDEVIVFSWIEYPDKETRDAASQKMMSDPRMAEMGANMPFDGSRMIYAGFNPIVDQGGETKGGYIDGILLAVPNEKRDAYQALATKTAGIFREFGALRVLEGWGDDVPDGKVTDYKGAVQATAEETVVFSWLEWSDKDMRNAGWAKLMEDERMKAELPMPFDGQRMMWGGFASVFDK